MNKQALMTNAHRIARSIATTVGDYQVAMKIALKQAWEQVKMTSKQTVTYTAPTGVELTVVRPNGQQEVIKHPTLKQISAAQFAQIQRDTKAAGRGDVLSYTNLTETKTKVIDLSEADQAVMSSERVKSAMTLNGKSY